jgi:hypothetical protein
MIRLFDTFQAEPVMVTFRLLPTEGSAPWLFTSTPTGPNPLLEMQKAAESLAKGKKIEHPKPMYGVSKLKKLLDKLIENSSDDDEDDDE